MVNVEHSSKGHSTYTNPKSLFAVSTWLAWFHVFESSLSSTRHILLSTLPLGAEVPGSTSSELAIIFPPLLSWGKHIQWKVLVKYEFKIWRYSWKVSPHLSPGCRRGSTVGRQTCDSKGGFHQISSLLHFRIKYLVQCQLMRRYWVACAASYECSLFFLHSLIFARSIFGKVYITLHGNSEIGAHI